MHHSVSASEYAWQALEALQCLLSVAALICICSWQPSILMTDSACVSCDHVAHMLQGILLPAVHDGETFSFCMCNPPFFETLQEAGRNPHTAYAGKVGSPLSVTCTQRRHVTSLLLCPCISQLRTYLCAPPFVLVPQKEPSQRLCVFV